MEDIEEEDEEEEMALEQQMLAEDPEIQELLSSAAFSNPCATDDCASWGSY